MFLFLSTEVISQGRQVSYVAWASWSVAADSRRAVDHGDPESDHHSTPASSPPVWSATTGVAILLALRQHMAGVLGALPAAGRALYVERMVFRFCMLPASIQCLLFHAVFIHAEHYFGGAGMVPWNFTAGEIAETFFFTLAWEAS